MLCESRKYSYLNVWKDFVDSFKLYKRDGLHLNDKGVKVFARRMDGCLSLAGKLEGRRDIESPLMKGCQFIHDNARSIRNKFVELKSYVNLEKPDIIFVTKTGKNFCTE